MRRSRQYDSINPVSTLTETVWTPAVLAGVVSMPATVGIYWYWSRYTSIPVFAVGVVVGYYYRHRSKTGIRVGTRMGLVGACPVVWVYSDILGSLAGIELSASVWSVAVQTGPVVLFFLLVTSLSTLMGFIGTLVGIRTVHYSSETATPSE